MNLNCLILTFRSLNPKKDYLSKYKKAISFLYFLILIINPSFGRNIWSSPLPFITFTDSTEKIEIGNQIGIFEDRSNSLTIQQIECAEFKQSKRQVPNLGVSNSSIWLKFEVVNNSSYENLVLEFAYPLLDSIFLFTELENGKFKVQKSGEFLPYNKRKYNYQNYIFDLNIKKNSRKTYYLKISGKEQLLIPLSIGTYQAIAESHVSKDILSGIYFGIILVMILYNLFIYFTVKDKSYLFYVVYIFFVGLTQAVLQGYTFKYFWPGNPWLAMHSTFFSGALVGIAVVMFVKSFLNTKINIPKFHRVLNIYIISYVISIILAMTGFYYASYNLIDITAGSGSILLLFIAYKIYKKGFRAAKFFLIAWSLFLLSVSIFVLKDYGVVPYNLFTYYGLQLGSGLEVILLSLALADRINILKKEKEESQAAAFKALKDNEQLIREQNLILERKVKERTAELQSANEEISSTLKRLKDAQAKLVESEKMASLGQLTAGIAHEINNPINFVTSSISPLKRDINFVLNLLAKYNEVSLKEDLKENFTEIHKYEKRLDMPYLKEEIETILKGIEEGASRTIEIVKGLKNFSRLDESELKTADVHEGLNSTLVLLNNKLSKIKIIKNYGKISSIECYAGKINQVFMNLLSNAIHAVCKKNEECGEITITTTDNDNGHISVSIKDNGTGIPENIINKIFDPFFTTKDVGEGTGLGLSIVYSIIQTHKGDIKVNSVPGEGTEFTIILPKCQKLS